MPMGMGDKKPKIMLLLGKHPEPDGDEGEGDSDNEDKGDDPLSVNDDQVDAAREFHEAKTDEDRARALKGFIRLCEGDY